MRRTLADVGGAPRQGCEHQGQHEAADRGDEEAQQKADTEKFLATAAQFDAAVAKNEQAASQYGTQLQGLGKEIYTVGTLSADSAARLEEIGRKLGHQQLFEHLRIDA